MTWQWPKGAKEGDEVERVEMLNLVLGDHKATVIGVCAVKYRSVYGDETYVDQIIRREMWCSCGTKGAHRINDMNVGTIKVEFMWHVMEKMSPKVTYL